jgi:hypothetical protein
LGGWCKLSSGGIVGIREVLIILAVYGMTYYTWFFPGSIQKQFLLKKVIKHFMPFPKNKIVNLMGLITLKNFENIDFLDLVIMQPFLVSIQ